MEAFAVQDADEARQYIGSSDFDLVMLDIMVLLIDIATATGHESDFSKNGDEDAFISLMSEPALSDDGSLVINPGGSADYHRAKPLNIRDLLVRIRAALHRVNVHEEISVPAQDANLAFDGWELRVIERELTSSEDVTVPLSESEYRLLRAFLAHPKTVLTRDELLDIAYGRKANVYDRTIYNQVNRLRRKIEPDPKNPTLIRTAWGNGYIFTADVTAKA